MEIIHPLVQQYAEKYSSHEDAMLQELATLTRGYHAQPQMLSGHIQGKLLEFISRMIQPRRILEIGTFTGYSALCLAKGLTEDGALHTIELREQEANIARSFFSRSDYKDQIILHQGNALEIIPGLQETWDLVFIDADKTGYIEYFNLVFPKLRLNGFILVDNILFHGEVLESEITGKNAKAVSAFNEFLRERTDIDKLILTIRDGLFLI